MGYDIKFKQEKREVKRQEYTVGRGKARMELTFICLFDSTLLEIVLYIPTSSFGSLVLS